GLKEQHSTLSSELNMMNEIEAQETEEQIEEKIHHYSHEKNALSESIQKKRSKRLEMSTYVEDEERELKEMNKQLQQLAEKLKQKEVQANRLDVELENMLNHLQTEYTITYERAKQLYPKTSNSKQSNAIVQELKNQIERLGTVNLGAIEEYDRLTERYSFLTEQRNDLTEAKKTLYHVIAEMDEEMVSRFETTFKQIKKEFEIVFKQLFGGGHAELKLTEPSNLL